MSRTIELTIDSIAAGGDGVGRANGLVVFVPRTAPGDAARVRLESTGRFARGRLETLSSAGPARIEPACAHYVVDRCGGCQLQHLGYDAQLDAKSGIIHDSITRIGKRQVDRPTVCPSPSQWRYRRKLTLALRPKRDGHGWIAGLHPFDAPGRVFDLVDCPITDVRVLAVWGEIRRAARWLPEARELRGAVRLGAATSGPGDASASFVLEGGTKWPQHATFFDAVPSLSSLWWRPDNQSRRRLQVRASIAMDAYAPQSTDDVDVADAQHPDAGNAEASFIQVNAEVAAQLHRYVVARASAHAPSTVVDAYAGAGDTAVELSANGARVTAIELDREGAALGASRLSAPSSMIQGRVEDALPGALPADLVILNPPRAGVDASVTAVLQQASPRPAAILYVSCNPSTLARDIARLPGFRVASLVGFDMFPQTAHVETVCELVPEVA